MFVSNELKAHLDSASTVKAKSLVLAEWNLNIVNNIFTIGNYRYRPHERETLPIEDQTRFSSLNNLFDPQDEGNYYSGATDATVSINAEYNVDGVPAIFKSAKQKEKMLFSLEDCFGKFRPRSGINKLRYFENRFSHFTNQEMASRPRYYMADRYDDFKYWSSFRTEVTEDNEEFERGIANKVVGSQNYIDDVAPFIVYKNVVPANRIVIKMQTNVGTTDLGPFQQGGSSIQDPFFGDANKTTPSRWKVQVLVDQKWRDTVSFDENSLDADGNSVIKEDGYVELHYGSVDGNYDWYLGSQDISDDTSFVTNLVNPPVSSTNIDGIVKYQEFEYIQGIRLVVDTMNVFDSTFDLIELSPRLAIDITDRVTDYDIEKQASDLGVSGMPVGQLLASTGKISIFDFDRAFSAYNSKSILKDILVQNVQLKLYETLYDDNDNSYTIPIKTMYAEEFPETSHEDRSLDIELRDLYFYFESMTAPQILLTDVSLSFAISTLLDSIGFSNYVFKRVAGESDPIIPYFFIEPDKTVAEVLEDLAVSTQHAMFFDEYNNFIVMSKNYILPSVENRPTDLVLYGSDNDIDAKPSIIDISSQENEVYNDGVIAYTTRYIQRSYGSIRQASLVDRDKTWIYKPALLWEVSPTESTKSINEQASSQSSYVLSAIPLNAEIPAVVPTVQGNKIINNVIDFGEGVYWMSRYNGYFYANGEIIKYDAVQYSIPGLTQADSNESSNLVWITSLQEYQRYFSKIPFNGKMYPTGQVRIYAEPNYETINGITQLQSGAVAKHGRGQFGTPVVAHTAGLDSYWSSDDAVRGCEMDASYLFGKALSDQVSPDEENIVIGPAGVSFAKARETTRNGIINNFLSSSYPKESETNNLYSTQTGTIQSSALVMNGRKFDATESPIDFISYVHKELDNKYKHFGTRMRIIGKINNDDIRIQNPSGSSTYYTINETKPTENTSVGGSSGGLAVMVDPETNVGYYFEIVALTESSVTNYEEAEEIHNIIFYKVMRDENTGKATPIKLWGGLSKILVDDGKFTGQYRLSGEENPTVYDLGVEYENVGGSGVGGEEGRRRFYLYINNKLVQVVDDNSPLPEYPNMGLFVRGSARCLFENIYALGANYSQNTSSILDAPSRSVFGSTEISVSESFRKYAMSGIVQSTYLQGIGSREDPKYNIYFDEFGTILREASYFNVRYDKAYPALYAKISPTFNRIKGYTVSGFTAGAYGAEFLVFNATDTAISLDETTGNYLRIQGVTFTQESENELSVDDYYQNRGSLSNPDIQGNTLVTSPVRIKEEYQDIRNSRITQGRNKFSIKAPYIQSQDDANELMSWITSKITKPRMSVGLEIFPNPAIQLGDIVQLSYADEEGDAQILTKEARFVVYNIKYTRSDSGPSMEIYLSEVF